MTVLLTPNRRLAATLSKQHQAKEQLQARAWKTPLILPIEAWFVACWRLLTARTFSEKKRLLSKTQAFILWQQVLEKIDGSTFLLNPDATAQLASSAFERLKRWQVDAVHPMMGLTEDGLALQRWISHFTETCLLHDWLDPASLPGRLTTAIRQGELPLPECIQLAGFMEMPPQYQTLLDAAAAAGCPVSVLSLARETQQQTDCVQLCLPDEITEIRSMACWAKSLHEQQGETALIGCIIPQLETRREAVLRIFTDVFSGETVLTPSSAALPFNISAGRALSDWPVVRTALLLCGNTETEKIRKRLQRSPFCSMPAKQPSPDLCLSAAAWPAVISQFLRASGWPGRRSLNSEEYQVTKRWLALLEEYATLETHLPPHDFVSAIKQLTLLADSLQFQPETPAAPVQISGILEAAGQPFTHAWIMGMDDSQWPFPPRPHPLIPLPLQKKYHMPHATAARELYYCTQLFQQWNETCANRVFSHAATGEGNIQRRPALFLEQIPVVLPESLALSAVKRPADILFGSQASETVTDTLAPVLAADEKIRGGIRILRLQAACPFRAFAELRLHARTPETDTPGLSPAERGNILHRALELLWQRLGHSSTLSALPEDTLGIWCDEAVNQAMTELSHSPAASRYLQLEAERNLRLVQAWLQHEKENIALSFRVVACEKPITVQLDKLTLSLRLDRIDELADGSFRVIDYKTGKHISIHDWEGERPAEPQLPLYCIAATENIQGIVFAQLHPDHLKMVGMSGSDPGRDWQQQRQEWQTVLQANAQAFCAGDARVDPRNAEACRECHLKTLCRIHEHDTV